MRILVLGAPDGQLQPLIQAFESATRQNDIVETVTSADRIMKKLTAGLPWDLLVLDYELGDGQTGGDRILSDIRKIGPEMPIAVVADHGDVNIASRAIQAGASDFLVRTGDLASRVATLLKKIRPHLNLLNHNRILREQNMILQAATSDRYRIIGESSQMLAVIDRVRRVATIPRPVLIIGERGTGKELIARAIHTASGEADRPMVVINCAAFTDSLLETELFGHERGAFTGADNQAYGKFEVAGNGTLFLDEIGNMSLSFQRKILRVVEYGTFTRVGGSSEIQVNTRIVAATNSDLKQLIRDGKFLHDLYDRLSFEVIEVPPLRRREGDIAILARHFLNEFMKEIPSLSGKHLSQAALDMLKKYKFPGNIRELKNIIERSAYRDTTNEITPEDLGLLPEKQPEVEGNTFYEKVEVFQKRLITEALATAGGNQARAAREIGLSYHQFRYFLKKYGGPQTVGATG
ncbi:Psp operon transcriptional activator [Olavius algarvensis Delta 1 endosymbiont]|nr:Psp operon transcriptional activator [Olavius algarvensis Delta 1 endosymbiont]